ncbi:hypothetical protein G3T14_11195 [Methylobacterium sp. BTF04]|uniref:hypothetical protein n=1 Tax=Methylobacterium sp. BTF04 TaxID=2708300 RepID=UPI0013D80453|nr:hypothetical protein [Methylobacterium sp. BTF04]NEU12702.1 hypothetical protein [Methylobacterium sp. BTF04]
MTIAPFNASTYVADRNTANLVGLKGRLDTLTTQLSTGRAADSYGGLGSARTTSLSAHAALSALDGYDSAITGATTRVTLASAAVTQISTLGNNLQKTLSATNGSTFTNTSQIASNSLDAAVDALNQSAAGQYVFGGRATDQAPVVSSDTILNGNTLAGLDGLKTLIQQQKAADLGPNANGRIATAVSGQTVTVSEEGSGSAGTETRANFGFRLLGATSSNPSAISAGATTAATAPDVSFTLAAAPQDGDKIRVAVNQADGSQSFVDLTAKAGPSDGSPNTIPVPTTAAATATFLNTRFAGAAVASIQGAPQLGLSANFSTGTPAQVAVAVNTTPNVGDTVTFNLALRDGTTQAITLTAAATADATSTTAFSTTGDVATNISNALANALKGAAATTLSASSASRATQDFFAGSKSAGLAPRRISADGNGYAEQASTKTVIWYTGDDTSTDPRATATVQATATRSLDIGVQANEAPIRSVLAGIALVAAESFTTAASGSADATRYNAVADRSRVLLGSKDGNSGIQGIASDLGLAASDLQDTQTQNRTTRAALQDSLDGVDTVSAESVTAQLLQLQTQLQASYQVTSMLSKLTLVSYLG